MKKMSGTLVLAALAGSLLPAVAMAQKSVNPGQAKKASTEPMAGEMTLRRAPDPDQVRRVLLMPDGSVQPISDWQPYVGRPAGGDSAVQYVFDAIQTDPNVLPGTLPTGNRYLLGWTAGAFDYSAAVRARDMADIPAAAHGLGAKMCDLLHRESLAATPLYVTIVTAETFSPTTPPDASWGAYPGIQLGWATGVGAGFWFSAFDVTPQLPPVGDGWKMPTDGSGAYIVLAHRDAAATQPANGWQTGLWGTGNNAQPPVARVGTQLNIEWTDDSTPPQCGAAGLATNLPNGILEGGTPPCEAGDFTFAVPAPAPTPLATALGFGMDVGTGPAPCYANCDGSTATPILNVNDFICFQQKYAAGDTYANCDNSTANPILNVNDFICFQQKYAAGCP